MALTMVGALPHVLGAAGQAAGGLLGMVGQHEQNVQNARAAREQMAFQERSQLRQQQFSAGQTKQQMDFQERMSSTSYQRQVQDLLKAGLNPALAYGAGGATSPPGAAGSISAAPGAMAQRGSTILQGISSALQIAKGFEEVRLMASQSTSLMAGASANITNALSQAGLSKAQVAELSSRVLESGDRRGLIKEQTKSEGLRQSELGATARFWDWMGNQGGAMKGVGSLLQMLKPLMRR